MLDSSAHELLHGTLASLEFSNDLANDGKHRHAPVVNLLTRKKKHASNQNMEHRIHRMQS